LDANAFTFRHLGIAVRSIDKAIPVYQDLFGYELVSGPFDDPIQKVAVCFLGRRAPGEITIELVAPLGDDSPVNRTLAKGGSAYHICYEVDDLDAKLDQLAGKGCLIVSQPVPAVAFNNRRIAWLYTPTRQLVEVLEK
jgi:methylmalonyl-CoA/ethylmalonyl-CoA epimerase